MQETAISLAALALIAGSAFAADLPPNKRLPVLPPPSTTWTGFHVGLNAGVAFGGSNSIQTLGAPIFAFGGFMGPVAIANALAVSSNSFLPGGNISGFIGGGEVGFSWQFYNSFVTGVEADIQGVAGSSKMRTTGALASLGPWGFPADRYASLTAGSQKLDYIGTVRGRLGFLATPTLMVYGTGGLAYGGVQMSTAFVAQESTQGSAPVFGGVGVSKTRVGWTAGGGAEWMFLPNWSARIEYLYYNLGNITSDGVLAQVNVFTPGAPLWGAVGTQTTARFDGHVVRESINYHFDWGSSGVLAKY